LQLRIDCGAPNLMNGAMAISQAGLKFGPADFDSQKHGLDNSHVIDWIENELQSSGAFAHRKACNLG
jgi:hypothetical protein